MRGLLNSDRVGGQDFKLFYISLSLFPPLNGRVSCLLKTNSVSLSSFSLFFSYILPLTPWYIGKASVFSQWSQFHFLEEAFGSLCLACMRSFQKVKTKFIEEKKHEQQVDKSWIIWEHHPVTLRDAKVCHLKVFFTLLERNVYSDHHANLYLPYDRVYKRFMKLQANQTPPSSSALALQARALIPPRSPLAPLRGVGGGYPTQSEKVGRKEKEGLFHKK